MAITRPTGEQLRFLSAKTGEHVLDTYLESTEKGTRTLPDLIGDLFDDSGVFRSANFELRFDESTDTIQFRAGNFSNSSVGWIDITTFFKITGTFSSSTTYNNFDLITLSTKDVYIVHGLSSGTTFSDEAAVIASANTDKLVDVSEAREWAKKTDGIVDSTDYSSKAWAIGGTGVTDTASKGAAKEWATKTGGTVDGSDYSAKHWATTGTVATVSSGIANINTVAGAIANVNTTATNISNVNTVAGINANVTTVAGISANVTTVASNNANVTTVATNNSNINALVTNMTDINTVADEIDNNKLQTVANNINAVVTAADDLNEATSEIDTVATNIANVNTVGGISANVTTVAGISANVTTVAGISANTTTVAGISANVTTVAGIASDVTTAAANTTAFNNTYLGAQSSAPTQDPDGSALDLGDLYFDTVADVLKVRASGGWINAGSAVNGTANRFTFTATSGQTTFTGADANGETLAYDSGYMDIYMNGVKLAAADYTASNGTSVIIAAAAAGDTLEMIAYGTFNLANVSINDLTDVNTTGLANNGILAYNSSNSRFEPTATPTFTSITVSGTVDGRDISADGATLDAIEANADVTDTANVTAAGALMDSEVTNLAQVKAFDATDYATSAQGTLAASAVQPNDSAALKELDLNAIATDISDTAVDVFVYDTSKDSDGGAWRKRTQHTSWYNEAASATRGSRKEFPAVAVIVTTSNGLTIYDGDDPDMPMWMVFVKTTPIFGRSIAWGNISSCSMLNGTLVFCNSASSAEAVLKVNFISDNGFLYPVPSYSEYGGAYTSDIASRANSYSYDTSGATVVVNSPINDVAMTVLPSAPIDAATGLPVPTIGIATNGGVSVIKDDGTVVDITGGSQGADMPIDQISFVGNHSVLFSHRYASEVSTIPSSDSSAAYYNQVPTFTGRITNSISHDDDTHLAALSSDNNIESIAIDEDNAVSKSVSGVSRHNHFAISGDTDRASAFITSSYNTGWMNGDIKLATLSDTDDTNVTGSELVTNGTMESNSGWGALGSPVSQNQSNEQAHSGTYSWKFVASGNYQGIKSASDMSVVSGKTYVINSWVYPVNDTGIAVRFGGVLKVVTGLTQGAWNEVTVTVTAVSTSSASYVQFDTNINFGGGTWYIDDVTARLAEEDRSVNGNGVQVVGSITKDPVASGADLVGYSGFSTSNYLFQPYNADIDFAAADKFCIMLWFKTTDNNTTQCLISLGKTATNTQERALFVNDGLYFVSSGTSSSTSKVRDVDDGNWHCGVVVGHGGANQSVYVDGKLDHTATLTLGDLPTDSSLFLGKRGNNSIPLTHGSLALVRISATAPSPEQIAKMYNDEKRLFQTGAQATLYAASPASGSPDAVTALAYDDTTELLHVGTDNGRSVFQGLRRVDNTTDAVGVAISASNGLVAED
jgi:hypothetical protein